MKLKNMLRLVILLIYAVLILSTCVNNNNEDEDIIRKFDGGEVFYIFEPFLYDYKPYLIQNQKNCNYSGTKLKS